MEEVAGRNVPTKPPTAKFSWKSDHPDGRCGCGPCLSPRWIQWLRWPPLIITYFWIVGVVIYMGMSYSGAVLPAIERRFGLSSSQSGFLVVLQDIMAMSVCVFTSFYADRSSRPMVIGLSLLLMALGKLLTALPHFLSEPLDPGALLSGQLSTGFGSSTNTTLSQHLCTIDDALGTTAISDNGDSTCNEEAVGLRGILLWAVIGQLIYGLGQASFTPIIIPYLDDLAGRVRSRYVIYFTIFCTIWTGGPALGYFLGGVALEYYVDFERIPKDQVPVGISRWDPRWIGAWWIGYVVSATSLFVLSIPAFLLPKDPSVNVCVKHRNTGESPADEALQENDKIELDFKQTESSVAIKKGFKENAKVFLPVLKRILTRPVLVFYMFFMTIELTCISVFVVFVVKYFMLQFGISGMRAAVLNGVILIPAAILGLCTSAFICRHFKLTLKQCAIYLLINNIIAVALIAVATFIGCENPSVAGVNVMYPKSEINGTCNSQCGCRDNVFRPVCGPNGLSYLSPCHAGCQSKESTVNSTGFSSTYSGCSCVALEVGDEFGSVKSDEFSSVKYDEFGSVKSGLCERKASCEAKLLVVAFLFGAMAFCRFQDNTPMSLIVLGNSETEIRTTVFGVTKLVNLIFGFFPTPIYFGAIINSACWFWRYSCGSRGSCWLYDIVKLRYAFFGVNFFFRVLQIPVCIGILLTVKETLAKSKGDQNANIDGNTTTSGDNTMAYKELKRDEDEPE